MTTRGARLGAMALLALALVRPLAAQVPASTPPDKFLVVPFENPDRDPGMYWLTEGAAILLTDALNDSRVTAITRTERVRAFEQLHLPEATVLSRATVIKVGQLVGATRVIAGTLQRIPAEQGGGETLLVHVRSIRLDTGRLEPDIVERAPMTDLFEVFEHAAARLLGRATDLAPVADRPPLGAFESYVKGLLSDNPDTRVKFLLAAVAAAPQYDRARLALWDARTAQGDHARALIDAQTVPATSPWSRRARFDAALSLIALKRYDEAFSRLKALGSERPAAAIDNNMGVVQIRRGAGGDSGKPAYFFNRAVTEEPADPNSYFNLGYAYALDNDPQAAIYWLRESVRRNPADPDAHFVLGSVLQAGATTAEAKRELELARQLSARYEELARRAADDHRHVPPGLERLKMNLEPALSELETAIATPAQREQREMAAFYLDRGKRLFEEQRDREALMELRRATYLSPYNAEAHLLIGRIYLRARQVPDAIGALKISIWSEDTLAARLALAEAYLDKGDRALAREQAERALVIAPGSAEAKQLLARASGG